MKYIIFILSLITAFSSQAQNSKSDIFNCKDSYTEIEGLINKFTELRDSMSPINRDKKLYLDNLRWKVLNGSLSEKKALSQTYYSDPDYPIYSIVTSLNFVINEAVDFRAKKRWEDDRDLLDKAVDGTLTIASNGLSNNPYHNMMRQIELSRNVSLLLDEYSRTVAALKAKGQLYKIGVNETFSWDISSYYFTISNITYCHLSYLQNKTVVREINSNTNKN